MMFTSVQSLPRPRAPGRRVLLTARSLWFAGCASTGRGLVVQALKSRNLGVTGNITRRC